jgi:hypothetical protein
MSVYSKAKAFIKTATDSTTLYDKIREILRTADEWHYPEDWQIKELQRLADAKFAELGGN